MSPTETLGVWVPSVMAPSLKFSTGFTMVPFNVSKGVMTSKPTSSPPNETPDSPYFHFGRSPPSMPNQEEPGVTLGEALIAP